MAKLIVGNLVVFGLPQAIVQAFFAFAHHMLPDVPDLPMVHVVVTGIVLAGSLIIALLLTLDATGWLPEYFAAREERQKALAREQELTRKWLDKEVGIPRPPELRR